MVPPRNDGALAVGLLALRLLTLIAGWQESGGIVSYIAAPFWMLPLAWRSRFPLAVAITVATADLVDIAVGGYHDSVPELLALILAQYSLGSHAKDGRRLLAGVAALLGVSVWTWLGPQHEHSWSLLGDAALAVSPVFAGLWVRQQRLRAQALE